MCAMGFIEVFVEAFNVCAADAIILISGLILIRMHKLDRDLLKARLFLHYVESNDPEKLRTRVKSLELQLIQERQRTAQLNVKLEGLTDEMILESLTSKKFTDTDTLIQTIINQHFGHIIIQPVMDALYRLAEQGQVEYSRKINSWRLKV